MDIFDFFVYCISFSGLLFGILLYKKTRNEVEPGYKYLRSLMIIIYAIIMAVFINNFSYGYIDLFFVFLGVLIAIIIRLDYLTLGLANVISYYLGTGYFYLISALIFLAGLPYGSLKSIKIKRINNLVMINLLFFMIPLALILIKIDILNAVIAFCIGSMSVMIIKD